jgi:glyoxalase superfamily protein/ClpA/ClpB-like protein
LPERTGQQRKLLSPGFVQAKDEEMRDFRDAKAMAHTLRAGLAARGLKITNSQSLELIAEAFGVADWNTLSAAIHAEAETARNNVSPPVPTAEAVTGPRFSRELESALHRALAHANQRKHEYSTLEHLLLALIDEPDASAVMRACGVDLGVLKDQLASYLDNDLKMLVIGGGSDAQPTAAFQRVVQRAVIHIQVSGRHIVTGANLLVAVFAETQSPAASLLAEQGMTRLDAVNFIAHGIVKDSGGAAKT